MCATVAALRSLGVPVAALNGGTLRVEGVDGLRDPSTAIDCGNSGTTMRLLTGLIAGRAGAVLDGDSSLRRRPMERVAEPLRAMGAEISTSSGGVPPLTVRRSPRPLRGAAIAMTHASAQVKSAVLLAAMRAEGETSVSEPLRSRDHTERMLAAMGAAIAVRGTTVVVRPGTLEPIASLEVPGDFSAAFFFIAGAAVIPGSRLLIRSVGVNPTRIAAMDVAREMGVDLRLHNDRVELCEPVADIEVIGGASLRGVSIAPEVVPNLIDEVPALCALASIAGGDFVVRGASELRIKESDRIATTAALLRSFGVRVEELPDGVVVRGGRSLSAPESIPTNGDHRIGMSAAILAAAAHSGVVIEEADCIATSFPNFFETWASAFGA